MAGDDLRPFESVREIGRGGAGVVHAVRWQGRDVALKVAQDGADPREQRRFLEEAELLSRVSHPAVVEVLGSGSLADGRAYLLMPLIQGETLAARLERGRLDPDLALRLFSQLADAVVLMHDAGIVHRDIKPENVMFLGDEERLVLLDFGIARELESAPSTTTRMNLVRGTPSCMAPERFFGTRASAASDVYELGVTLYAMLAGALPWDDPTDPEARLRPRAPADLGILLPAGLAPLILETLTTRPERRPGARALATRVRAIASGLAYDPTTKREVRAPVALPAQSAPLPYAKTELANATPPAVPAASAARARSIVPPPASEARGASDAIPRPPWWLTAGFVAAAASVAIALGARGVGRSSAQLARTGALSVRAGALVARLHDVAAPPTSSTASASAAPTSAPNVDPTTEATAAPRSPVSPAASAPSTSATTIAPQGTQQWCKKLVDLYCTPAARKMPGGDARCEARRADLARTSALPDTTRARAEDGCRDAIPALERSIKAPQGSENAEDMPWCKRVAAAYCSPEVKNTYGGDSLCAQGQQGFYTRYTSAPPADRAAQNEKCAQTLPAVIQSMKEHVKNFGPGGAASARVMQQLGGAGAPAPKATP